MPARPTVWIRLCACFLSCFALVGCAFRNLDQSLHQLSGGTLEVTVSSAAEDASKVLVVLLDADTLAVANASLLPGPGVASLFAPAGDYSLVAFADQNGNLQHEPDEPASVLGFEEPIHVEPEAGQLKYSLTLERVSPDRPLVPAGTAERAAKANRDFTYNNLGAVAPLEDPRFDRDNADLGMWQPAEFLEQGLLGVYMLEPYDPQRIPVVFVHGFAGTPRDFEQLTAALDRSRFQAWVVFYPTSFPLEGLGRFLAKSLRLMLARTSAERWVLVAHSMGGLVATSTVRRELTTEEQPRLFVTLASPLAGMTSARAGVDYAPTVMPCWYDLAPGSEFLGQLYAEPAPATPYHLFFAYRNSGLLAPSGDGVVPLTSQLRPEAERWAKRTYGVDADHVGILNDVRTHEALREILESVE